MTYIVVNDFNTVHEDQNVRRSLFPTRAPFVTVIYLFTDSMLMEEPCCSKIGHVTMFLFSTQCRAKDKSIRMEQYEERERGMKGTAHSNGGRKGQKSKESREGAHLN